MAGRLSIVITGDAADAQRALSSLNGAFENIAEAADSAFERVSNTVTGFFSTVGQGVAMGLGFGLITSAVDAVRSAFGLARTTVIEMNAELETASLQFTKLIGSADEARDHVNQLFQFAKDTPFDAKPVIEASRLLRTFGGATLDTADHLRRVGDAAAGVSQPIEQVAFWFGRAYSAIQAGQPFGEARMRLQEMGILTPQAAMRLQELEAAGASAAEKFAVLSEDFDRFNGSMASMADTWRGLTAGLSDAIGLGLAQMFEPLFTLAKDGMKGVLGFLESDQFTTFAANVRAAMQVAADAVRQFFSMLANAGPEIGAFASDAARTMGDIANQALTWGANVVGSLADGMASGLSAVVAVVDTLASILTFWLAPGSPPRFLPDLDKWGQGAMDAYLQGWGDADFRIFDDIAGYAENALKLAFGELQGEGLQTLAEVRVALANVLNEGRGTGEGLEAAFQRLSDAAGDAGGSIVNATRLYVDLDRATRDLTSAQDELNRVTREYDEAIRPLQAELDEITRKQRDLSDQKRLASMRERVAKGQEDPEALALAEREYALKRAIDAKKAEKDAAVDAAQQKIDVAQEEEQAIKKQIAAIEALQKTQLETQRLMESASKGGGGGGGAAGGIANKLAAINPVLEEANRKAREAQERLAETQRRMEAIIAPWQALMGLLTTADPETRIDQFNVLAAAIGETPAEKIALLTSGLQGFFQVIGGDQAGGLDRIGAAIDGLAGTEGAGANLRSIGDSLKSIWDAAVELWPVIQPVIVGFFGWLQTNGPTIAGIVAGIAAGWAAFSGLTAVAGIVASVMAVLGPFVPIVMTLATAFGVLIGVLPTVGPMLSSLSAAASIAGPAITALIALLGGPVTIAIAAVALAIGVFTAAWIGNWFGIRDTLTDVWMNYVQPALTEIGAFLGEVLPPLLDALGDAAGAAWNLFASVMLAAWEVIRPPLEALMSMVGTGIGLELERMKSQVQIVWPIVRDIIKGAVDVLIGQLRNLEKGLNILREGFEAFKKFLEGLRLPDPFRPLIDAKEALDRALGQKPATSSGSGGSDTDAGTVGPEGPVGRNAAGTNNWRGGWTTVGEEGIELLNLPRGSQILSNSKSTAALGSGGVTINNLTIAPNIPQQVHDSAEAAGAGAREMADAIVADTLKLLGDMLTGPRLEGA